MALQVFHGVTGMEWMELLYPEKKRKKIFWIQCPLDWAKGLGMEVFLVETSYTDLPIL